MKPITMLIRRHLGGGRLVWERWGEYDTAEEADADWKTRVKGRGLTAWSWWGPSGEARKMLADPDYTPPEGA